MEGFAQLNSDDPERWNHILYHIIKLKRGAWDGPFTDIVSGTKIISQNWTVDLPVILNRLDRIGIGIDKFFKIERTITFKLASLVSDTNELYKSIIDPETDISRFVDRLNHAFLPKAVYNLEEFGLPRMVSKKYTTTAT